MHCLGFFSIRIYPIESVKQLFRNLICLSIARVEMKSIQCRFFCERIARLHLVSTPLLPMPFHFLFITPIRMESVMVEILRCESDHVAHRKTKKGKLSKGLEYKGQKKNMMS